MDPFAPKLWQNAFHFIRIDFSMPKRHFTANNLIKSTVFTFLPKFFHIDYPEELSNELLKCKTNAEVEKIGIEWGIEQSKELMQKEVPCIHYYTMSNSDSVKAIAKKIF